MSTVNIPGFEAPYTFTHDGASHPVYCRGEGPAILVMHELPGMTKQCIALCNTIADQGFRIYLPLLFGGVGKKAILGNTLRVCVSKEFHMLAADRSSPIVDYFRALLVKAVEECGAAGQGKAGVIGMCLTGNFAITLIAEPGVNAAVAAQPSLPIRNATALHMSATELQAVKDTVKQMGKDAVIGIKYDADPMCPNARFERLKAELGDGFTPIVLPGNKHATLTEHLDQGALDKSLAYLRRQLL